MKSTILINSTEHRFFFFFLSHRLDDFKLKTFLQKEDVPGLDSMKETILTFIFYTNIYKQTFIYLSPEISK